MQRHFRRYWHTYPEVSILNWDLGLQIVELFIRTIPIACVARSVVFEAVFAANACMNICARPCVEIHKEKAFITPIEKNNSVAHSDPVSESTG